MNKSLIASFAFIAAAGAAQAQVYDYSQLYVGASGTVQISGDGYAGGPSFIDIMGYLDTSTSSLVPVATNQDSGGGVDSDGSVTLTGLTPGSELVLYLQNPYGDVFYTGPGSRNSDHDVHAITADQGSGDYLVEFEDLASYEGSDFNYGDGTLQVSGVTVTTTAPGPEALIPFGLGLVSLIRRRKSA